MSDLKPFTSGFMKPPKEHQFKLGQSGNPRGRPKKKETLATITKRVLKTKVKIKGQDRKITIEDALALRLRELLAKGHRQAIEIYERYEPFSTASMIKNRPPEDPKVPAALIAMGVTIVDGKFVEIADIDDEVNEDG